MDYQAIESQLPPIEQKIAILLLSILALAWIVQLVRIRVLREEHALLWFIGLAIGTLVVWVDPMLAGITYVLGIDIPASALILLTLVFLLFICVWLTTSASRQKEQLAQLTITISILRFQMAHYRETSSTPASVKPENL